jgi:Fe-coproporphyrin III synthase
MGALLYKRPANVNEFIRRRKCLCFQYIDFSRIKKYPGAWPDERFNKSIMGGVDMHKGVKKTVSFSNNAVNIFFHLLTRCNLRCAHCYINPKQHGKKTLPLPVIEKWLYQLKGDHEEANLIFLGGEPTLHPELPGAVKLARQMGFTSITVDTNGYLFHDILSKTTPDEVDYFSFSLDGATRKTNDLIRGKGCYDACLSGLKHAIDRGFCTSVIFTASRMNIHELEMMADVLKDFAIDRFFIQVIGERGKSVDLPSDAIRVSRRTWTRAVPAAAEKIAALGIKVIYPKVFLAMEEPFECAGKTAHNYFVFPNGRVYQCPLCEDFPLHGMIFENDSLTHMPKINERDLFELDIPEGCVMNRLISPDNIARDAAGRPEYKIACCMLKEEVTAPY